MNQSTNEQQAAQKMVAEQVIDITTEAIKEKNNVLITTTCGRPIYIYGSDKNYKIPDKIDQISWVMPSTLLASEHLDASPEGNCRPIDELLWTTGYYTSPGCLSNGGRRDDVIKLTQWPNLTRLPHRPCYHRIAALLTTRPTSVVLAAKLLNLPEAEMYRFYNAASYAGYIRAINRKQPPPKPTRHKHHSILQRLFKKLTSSSQA